MGTLTKPREGCHQGRHFQNSDFGMVDFWRVSGRWIREGRQEVFRVQGNLGEVRVRDVLGEREEL